MATDPQAADEDQSMTQGNTDATASQAESETKPQPAVLELKQPLPTNTTRTPEPSHDPQGTDSDTPSTPGQLAPFDWEDFEARYEAALREADDNEREILKEAESLSKVASSHATAPKAILLVPRLTFTVFSSLGSGCVGPRRRTGCEASPDPTALRQLIRRKGVTEAKAL
ncbi:peroxisomal biogenesis factor 2 [Purpureocillium lavendulum]|uniref:Peroxisomal biogenesis factor 2 n=1 Tax=Purpureocillium lavendulum TaxID=1247861 RepID=A0AB34FUD3_9HYPO|nr:peroxisomal biogenesis factor 2 [Purpureocillium lavendulum]